MFWDDKLEQLSRDEMTKFQCVHLKEQVKHAYENSPFYKLLFDDKGVHPDDIGTIEDIYLLPFTTKSDLREHYPFGFCTVPMSQIVRVHASSGTTGKPTPVFYTRKDLEDWTHCMARNCTIAGIREDDVCQMAFRYTLFTGAFGHHAGTERIGATVIPASSGQTERHILLMQDFRTTVLHCTPSYAITIAEKLLEMGIDKDSLSLRLGIHGAEPMSEELRKDIEEKLGITSLGDYGLTELGGPGVSIECLEKKGYHINEDYFYPEIINPETMEPCPTGEIGELVFTSLQKKAVPLIRYRTRDITCLETGKCGCGRTLIRHQPIRGRNDDMLIIGGVNFFPSQLENLLLGFDGVAPHYLIHIVKKGRRDNVFVDIEVLPSLWAESDREKITELTRRIETRIRDMIGFRMDVNIVSPMTIPRSEGKAKRIVDER